MSTPKEASPAVERRVLWAANVRNKSLDDRIRAANVGGFTHMSVFPIDYRNWTSHGETGLSLGRRIEAAGLKVIAIDPFVHRRHAELMFLIFHRK